MTRTNVSSSNLSSIGYNSDSRTLEIEFHSGGVYEYYHVPESVYTNLMNANSHGIYFNANIKKNYDFKQTN